jgi:hypothetical protein
VAGDHFTLRVNQHRYVEAECLDASRDLPDLSWRVSAWVSVVELEVGYLSENESYRAVVSIARIR